MSCAAWSAERLYREPVLVPLTVERVERGDADALVRARARREIRCEK